MQQRNQSLDALRGFAILTMVLSGSIAYGDTLPAWMYHAQVPPPDHKFISTIPGITWVDLVFPFFLFSMGAAIPLALNKAKQESKKWWYILWIATRRFLLLTWFALFTHHMMAWVQTAEPNNINYLLSIVAFILLFFELYDFKNNTNQKLFLSFRIVAYLISVAMLCWLPFNEGKGFLFDKSDIIIIVLGNMAFFGTLIWWFTKNTPLLRLGILPFIMAVFLGGMEAGSWNETLYNFSPLPWMYKFYYLKYLFIIIPGTFAGEWLLQASFQKNETTKQKSLITIFCLGLIICNTALLFNRQLVLNLLISISLLAIVYFLLKEEKNSLVYKFFIAGAYLLLLGLFFEAYEGGIKKDRSTYSYYFVTSGLAFFMLIVLQGLQQTTIGSKITQYLSLNGRNPMIAYVAGNLLLLPLLNVTGIAQYWNDMNTNAWIGFLKGALFTGIVSIITIYCTNKKWFWKT